MLANICLISSWIASNLNVQKEPDAVWTRYKEVKMALDLLTWWFRLLFSILFVEIFCFFPSYWDWLESLHWTTSTEMILSLLPTPLLNMRFSIIDCQYHMHEFLRDTSIALKNEQCKTCQTRTRMTCVRCGFCTGSKSKQPFQDISYSSPRYNGDLVTEVGVPFAYVYSASRQ